MSTDPVAKRSWLRNYPEGVPVDLPPMTETLADVFDHTVERFPERPAHEFFGRRTSYAQLGLDVSRTAEGLRRLGVQKGDRVAIVLPNCPQAVVAFYAALRLGAIVVLHNPTYSARELRYIFSDHGATVAIVWSKLVDMVVGLAADDDVPIEHVVTVELIDEMPLRQRLALAFPVKKAKEGRAQLSAKPTSEGVVPWRQLQANGPLADDVAHPGVDDLAVIQYTSGTTGNPQGAMLTHANLRANAEQVRVWLTGLEPGCEAFYGVLPFFHAYGLTLVLTTGTLIGAEIVIFPSFDVARTAAAMKRTQASFLPAVPPIYEALLRAAERGEAQLAGIKYAMCGGMSLSTRTVERWVETTGGVILEGYGLSEASPAVTGAPETVLERKFGTVGVPMPGTSIRIVDPDDPSRDRGPGEGGELLVKGPQVFRGYWRNEASTAATLLPGGWLRTGDLVTISDDGYLTIVDRVKDLIITGGFSVMPSEVETVLVQHPDVAELCVFGRPREGGGESVCAAIVLVDGAMLDTQSLRAFARESLAPYKVPRQFFVVDALPKSIIGKVARRRVRDEVLSPSVASVEV